MSFTLQDIAWHRSVGQLVEALDAPDFWIRLVRLLEQYVPFDSWVALLFSQGRPQVFAECPGADGGPDPLFQDYLRDLYLLDPFYIASRENPCSGLFRLADVAPECFEQTDYYQRYFRLNVVADEIQINVQLSGERTLCLSLGSRRRFTPEQLAVLGLVRPWVAGLMRQRLAFEDEVLNSPAAPEPGWQGSLEKVAEQMGTPLTARELEVGRLMLSGCSSKEIARKLAISAETVKVHRKHMYGKLGIKSQSELFGLFLQAQG
ncbi:TPA: helix-turn-helix transcriptional regulator [Pseudomonas aeruginosa]|uniref:helix-turn-helix transcriptional regulator n=1 Tax=Pseudomonas aeruginosa TaxID=287 RepID=UPI000F521C00|nr:helix-turn-helix transcriptional regulator [Pseudomonas aeruginosa]RQD48836.1 helix-turn-helix transcriptional regulator [Pseudomonas aeruginosa]HBO6331180.1 helix-turn-helix transcriptional regulator [Pseudomonas aeruginosa]HCL3321037.1 helix-turn-helix transcriptional regulator [Pseudomonas aeruginosa]HCR1268634.1 helix-turn-helix transcriptional regulator [Pseudomonas aeruginosa]